MLHFAKTQTFVDADGDDSLMYEYNMTTMYTQSKNNWWSIM